MAAQLPAAEMAAFGAAQYLTFSGCPYPKMTNQI
jgi:hypothetical protein